MSDRFEPAMYSLEAHQFLLEHAGEPPEIAFRDGFQQVTIPSADPKAPHRVVEYVRGKGTLARADIYPIIDKLYRYDQQAKFDAAFKWIGVDKVKETCQVFLAEMSKWERGRSRGGPAFPSSFAWDKQGRGHRYGIGSDAGIVHTYFDEKGQRHPLGLDLLPSEDAYTPDWIKPQEAADFQDLLDDEENGVVSCPICKFSQTYQVGSQQRRNIAKSRMAKHLLSAKKEPEAHKQLHSYVFGTADAKRG